MGQQQILLIVLSVILVGIAIAVGITMFQAQAEQSNLDAIYLDLNNAGAQAYQYRIRPVSMGGGGGSYVNFEIPAGMVDNENAEYGIVTAATDDNEPIVMAGWSEQHGHGVQISVSTDGTITPTEISDRPTSGDFEA